MSAIPPSITIKAGHVQPLWAGHPWVFKQAVANKPKNLEPGDEVLVIDSHGKILGRGLFSPKSAISVRLYTSQGARPVDKELFGELIGRAVARRRAIGLPDMAPDSNRTNGYRLLHGEGDGLPGLIVDVFDDVLSVQFGTIGLKRRQAEIVEVLTDLIGASCIIDRTPANIARMEGFEVSSGKTAALIGEPPDKLAFHELGARHELPIELTQKTGYYFDQRPLRKRIRELSRGSRVLDACCYTGSIGIAAALGGASEVWGVDSSAPAVVVAAHNAALNGVTAQCHFAESDAARAFRKAADDGGYDIVICDPPKMASGKKGRDKALTGYRKMAANACAAVKSGGLLAMCSCSASVSAAALQRALALGARDARRRAIITERLFQGGDHPVPAAFSEGLYLKVLLARIDDI